MDARLPCPSPTPGVYSNSCPSSQWCHPTISSSVIPVSSCPQSFPASGSFQMSQLFTSGGQHIGVSASASPVAQAGNNLPAMQQTWSWENPLEEEMATHSSILTWRIPWTVQRSLVGYSSWTCKELDKIIGLGHNEWRLELLGET